MDVHRVHPDGLDPPKVIEAPVAGDPVEPGTDVDRPLVGQDRVEGGGEDLLEHVLGVLPGAEEVPAEGEKPGVVARDQHLKGGVVAPAQQRDQPLIGLQAQQR